MRRLIKSYLNKRLIVDILIIFSFCIISLIYFNPLLSGKKIKQSDIDQFSGMSRQIVEHRDNWTKLLTETIEEYKKRKMFGH